MFITDNKKRSVTTTAKKYNAFSNSEVLFNWNFEQTNFRTSVYFLMFANITRIIEYFSNITMFKKPNKKLLVIAIIRNNLVFSFTA